MGTIKGIDKSIEIRARRYKRNFQLEFERLYPYDMYDHMPEDNRYLVSGIEDIEDGDTFADYVSYFFDSYGDDLFNE